MNLFGNEWLHLQWHASNSEASHINTQRHSEKAGTYADWFIAFLWEKKPHPCISGLTNRQCAIKALRNTCQFPFTLTISLTPTWSVMYAVQSGHHGFFIKVLSYEVKPFQFDLRSVLRHSTKKMCEAEAHNPTLLNPGLMSSYDLAHVQVGTW